MLVPLNRTGTIHRWNAERYGGRLKKFAREGFDDRSSSQLAE
jgi:hypothetical protein